MKKLFKIVFSVLISLTAVFSTLSSTFAEQLISNDNVNLYKQALYYFYKIDNTGKTGTLTQANTYTNARADVERKIWEINKTDTAFAQKAKKLLDFWQEADAQGFTHVYHVKEDLSINKDDMIYDFPNDDSVVIFMYGNAMDASGNMSAENIGRCNVVLALAQQYPNAYIALSGGHTQTSDKTHKNEPKYVPQYDSEAGASFKYLTQTALQPTYMDGTFIEGAKPVLEEKYIDATRPKIDPSRIILDECAQDTVGNIKNSMAKLAAYPKIKNFIAVTGAYHIPRASLLLMTNIFMNGYDKPVSEGGRGYKYIGNLGLAIDKAAESNSTMASGSSSIATDILGITTSLTAASGSLPLSTPLTLKVTPAEFSPRGTTNVADLFKSVEVTFQAGAGQDAEGFVYDAKDVVTVTGFDKDKLGTQHISVSYTYNKVTLNQECDVNIVKPVSLTVTPADYTLVGSNSNSEMFKSAKVAFINKESGSEPDCKSFVKDVTADVKVPDFRRFDVGYQEVTVKYSVYGVNFEEKCTVNVVNEKAQNILKDLVQYFTNTSFSDTTPLSQVGQASYAEVERKLRELQAVDPVLANRWRLLLQDWRTVNADGFTNVYHAKSDYSVNTDDMVYGLPNDKSLAIFMYGNAMDASGNMSAENIGRCNAVLALAQQYPNAYILLSGGHTQSDDKKHTNEPRYIPQYDSEAGASYKYLTQTALQPTYMDGTFIEGATPVLEEKYIDATRPKIDPSRIILDECAQDTVGNITNTMAKLKNYPEIKNFVTVTSDYHIPRATLLLMSFVRTRGLNYNYVGNLGSEVLPKKTESIALQKMSFTGIVGVTIGFADPNLTISTPKEITVKFGDRVAPYQLSEEANTPIEVSKTDGFNKLHVIATFENTDSSQNVSKYSLDVADKVVITGYDEKSKDAQLVTFTYTYNGETVETKVNLINVEKTQEELKPSYNPGHNPGSSDSSKYEERIQELEQAIEQLKKDTAAKIAELEGKVAAQEKANEALKKQFDELAKGEYVPQKGINPVEGALIGVSAVEAIAIAFVGLRKKKIN